MRRPYGMPCPYDMRRHNHNNPMHMIGHYHKFIQQDMGNMVGDRQPTLPDDVPHLI